MADMVQHAALAGFLRARRESTDPVTVGLRPGPRRRTPGLRREEVAQLSGVSVSWYTWLEQARPIGVSGQVVDSLARSLRLSAAERLHLYTLAGLAPPPDTTGDAPVDDLLRRLLDAIGPNPAYVMNRWWDLLAYNRTYAALLGGLDHRAAIERNSLWLLFTDDQARGLFVDWPGEARQLVGQLRANLARQPGSERGQALVAGLRACSPRFAELWDGQTVGSFEPSRKRLRHPDVGRIDLDYVKLATADGDGQHLVAFLPADEASAAKVARLDAGRPPSRR